MPHSGAPQKYDPYELSPEAVVEPPKTLGQILHKIGPGMILAGSIVGTGELIATTNLGARAGFALLWLVLVSCFVKVFVQIELGRYAISSGNTTLSSFRRVPGVGALLCWWWFIMMLMTQMQIGAMIGGVASALSRILDTVSQGNAADLMQTISPAEVNQILWAVLVTAVTIVLLVRGSYFLIEKLSTVLVAGFTIMTVVCVALLPLAGHPIHWDNISSGLSLQIPAGTWGVAFAMVGITGVGAVELISYPYWCLEKGYARYIGPPENSEAWLRRAEGWLRVMRVDAWLCMIVYTVATVAFYLLGAAVLHNADHPTGLPGDVEQMLDQLTAMYTPVLGSIGANWFLTLGAIIVLYSTLFAATAANSRITVDFLRVQNFLHLRDLGAGMRWIRIFCVIFPVLGLLLFLFFRDAKYMVIIGGIAQAATLPMIAAVAIYLRWRVADRRLILWGVWDACLWLSLAVFTIAAAYGVWIEVSKAIP